MKREVLRRSLAVSFALAAALFGSSAVAAPFAVVAPESPHGAGVRVVIDPMAFDSIALARSGEAWDFPMPDGTVRPVFFRTEPVPLVAPGAVLTIHKADGRLVERSLPPAQLLHGEIDGDPASTVSLVRFGGVFAGTMTLDGRRFDIVPGDGFASVSDTVEILPPAPHSWPPRPRCAVADTPPPEIVAGAGSDSPASLADSFGGQRALKVIELGIDTTHEFFVAAGGEESAATNYVVALLAQVSTIYRRDLGVVFSLSGLRVFDNPADPYPPASNSVSFINELRNQLTTGVLPPEIANADLVHLLHRNSAGSLGGIANIDSVCDTNGNKVGFSDLSMSLPELAETGYAWDVDVLSHELGHNCGAVHTHCMNPPIDECFSGEPGCHEGPAVQTRGTIMSYCYLFGYGNNELTFHPRTRDVILTRLSAVSGCLTLDTSATPSPSVVGSPTPTASPSASPSPEPSQTPMPSPTGVPSDQSSVVLASLTNQHWQYVTLPDFFAEPTGRMDGGLGFTVAQGSRPRFGFWMTRRPMRALPAGHYEITAHVTASRDSVLPQPEFRLRVFSVDNSYTQMGISAQGGTNYIRSEVQTTWKSDGQTAFFVALDVVAGTPYASGEVEISRITVERIR